MTDISKLAQGMYDADQKRKKKQEPLVEDKRPAIGIVSILIILFVIALSIFMLVTTGALKPDINREDIGRMICRANNLSYMGIFELGALDENWQPQRELRCGLNITYPANHYNITPDPFVLHFKVDWDYYKNGGKNVQ